MDKSTLKSALKLSKKAVAELKVAAKMVPDRRRQRDIELKVMAAEKLLRKVQDQITGDVVEETKREIRDTKQSRFQKIDTDKSIFERTQEALMRLKPENAEDDAPRTAPRISGEPSIFRPDAGSARLTGIGAQPGFFRRVLNSVSGFLARVKMMFRRQTKETLSDYKTEKDSRRTKLS